MNIQEYQSKQFFKSYNIPVLRSKAVSTVAQAEQAAKELGNNLWVLKAQVLAGGRGKAGGVKVVKSLEELKKTAESLLGKYLVTHQTDSKGEKINKLLVEEACSIEKEYYLSILLDPKTCQPVFIASAEGGVDIEQVSEKSPEKILKQNINPLFGFQTHHAWSIANLLGFFSKEEVKDIFNLCQNIYKLFIEKDATVLEINPLVKNTKGDLIALDGKMSFDENALYRHQDLQDIYKNQERDESENIALEHGISFIKLDGSIGCMVNGAGLAMSTMDIIKLYGSEPANFLDVGGGAEETKIVKAFEIILKSKEVKAILVNIFGGIMRCDIVALALIKAVKQVGLSVPVVVRLEGTKSKEGLKILQESGLDLIPAKDLDEAAKKVVEVSKK